MVRDHRKLVLVLMLGVAPGSASAGAPGPDAGATRPSRDGHGGAAGSDPAERPKPAIGLSTTPKVRGTFGGSEPDTRVVNRVVRSHINDFMDCYVERTQAGEPAKGEIHVEFSVDRTGQVTTSVLRSTTLHAPEVVTCVVEAFRKMQFPKPATGQVTVSYDVMFIPPH